MSCPTRSDIPQAEMTPESDMLSSAFFSAIVGFECCGWATQRAESSIATDVSDMRSLTCQTCRSTLRMLWAQGLAMMDSGPFLTYHTVSPTYQFD